MSLHAGPVGPDDAIHGGSRLAGPARVTVAYPPSDTRTCLPSPTVGNSVSLHAGPVGPDDAIHGGSRLAVPALGTVAYPPSDTCPVCRHPRAAFGRDCRWSRCPWDVERRPPGGRAGRSWSSTDGTYPWCGVVGISFVFHCFWIWLEDHLPPI